MVLGGPENDRGVIVRTTADGGFIIVGVTRSRRSGGEEVYLVRLDLEAAVRWETALGGAEDDDGWSVVETASGGFVVVGFSTDGSPSTDAALILKVDEAGQVLWTTKVLPKSAGQTFGNGVTATADGDCAITGHTTHNSAGGLDLFSARVDNEGRAVNDPPIED